MLVFSIAFSPFLTMFSILSDKNSIICGTFNLTPEVVLYLDEIDILYFCKGIISKFPFCHVLESQQWPIKAVVFFFVQMIS